MGFKLLGQAAVAACISFSGVLPASAQHAKDHGTMGHDANTMTQGEVRKVDKDARKITIKHEPLQNLDMPAMTMVFQIKDPALLDRVKAGDKVRFRAEKIDGTYAVTKIEPAK